MNKVFKYPLQITGTQKILMPTYSKILCVQNQYDIPTLYVQVSSYFDHEEDITIIIVGTGHPIPELELEYIGTVVTQKGMLVWHVYKEVN